MLPIKGLHRCSLMPKLKADVISTRANCHACTLVAPSNPALMPDEPVQPEYPFASICMDFFTVDATYLAMADRFSGWLSIFKLQKDDSAHVIDILRNYFSWYGVALDITSDGASIFTSSACREFFERWGMKHRVSSAYYPRANKRSELAVKSAKRLVMDNLGKAGSLHSDKFAWALLAHRNCPDPVHGLSPAMILYGRELRNHLPSLDARYKPRPEWHLAAGDRERCFAQCFARMEESLSVGAKTLPSLSLGDTVVVQDQQASGGKRGRWTKTGRMVEVLPHDSYMVVIDGSRAPTQQNRRFLKKISPFTTLLRHQQEAPVTPCPPAMMTRARGRAQVGA